MITQDTFSCIIYIGPSHLTDQALILVESRLVLLLSPSAVSSPTCLLLFSSRSRVSDTSELSAGVRPLLNGLISVLSPSSSAFTQKAV
jgi:hypothetical protein